MGLHIRAFYARLALLAAAGLVGLAFAAPASGEFLELIDVLEVPPGGVEEVGGFGGLTFHDEGLWIGYGYSSYSYYANGLPNGFQTAMAWVGQVSLADGTILETHEVPDSDWPYGAMTGLASHGDNLYAGVRSSVAWGIVEFDPCQPSHTVYPFEGAEPKQRAGGLAHDGYLLWQAHYSPDAGHLYGINTHTGQRMNDVSVDPYPYGLTWDGRYFYASHHDLNDKFSYIAQYDRSGAKVATLDLPPSLVNLPVGDLAVSGQDLYAHVLGTNTIAHLVLPAGLTAPALPPGLLNQSTHVGATVEYDSNHEGEGWVAESFEQLPVVASLRHTAQQSQMDVLGKARSYYDGEGVHNVMHAMAYGSGHSSDLLGAADLTAHKTLLISPQTGLPAGTPVEATGTLTLNGLLQAYREYGESGAEGLSAEFEIQIVKTAPGDGLEVFCGVIALVGNTDAEAAATGEWVHLVVTGDFPPAMVGAINDALCLDEILTTLPLEELAFDFSMPAVVGQPFEVDVLFNGQAVVPAYAAGLGAEAVFGEAALLQPGYEPPSDADFYDDHDLVSGWSWDPAMYVPEPATLLLLAVGAACARPRRCVRAS